MKMFKALDHVAIVVSDTEEALKIWRDRFGFPVAFSETIADGGIRLTHLDMGNVHLQLVEPLKENQPLWDWLKTNGPGFHHICLAANNLEAVAGEMAAKGIGSAEPRPHQGTQGKLALFLDRNASGGVQVEVTGD